MDWLETNVKAIGYRLKGMKKWRKKSKKKIISSDSTTLYKIKQYQYTVYLLCNVEYYNLFLIWTSKWDVFTPWINLIYFFQMLKDLSLEIRSFGEYARI